MHSRMKERDATSVSDLSGRICERSYFCCILRRLSELSWTDNATAFEYRENRPTALLVVLMPISDRFEIRLFRFDSQRRTWRVRREEERLAEDSQSLR